MIIRCSFSLKAETEAQAEANEAKASTSAVLKVLNHGRIKYWPSKQPNSKNINIPPDPYQIIHWWISIDFQTAQMYRSCGCYMINVTLRVCVLESLGTYTHRNECKLPTFKVLERFCISDLSFVCYFIVRMRRIKKKWQNAAIVSSIKWQNHYIRC